LRAAEARKAEAAAGKVAVKISAETGPSVIVEEPWHPLLSLRREMDRVFDEFYRTFSEPSTGKFPRPRFPAIDFVEREKEYVISAELPGMDENELEMRLSSGVLTMRGEKKKEPKEEVSDSFRVSEGYGSFERSFRLPEGIDEEKIDAKLVKGVLTIRLPKIRGAAEGKMYPTQELRRAADSDSNDR
jgi:HSP20 family protein